MFTRCKSNGDRFGARRPGRRAAGAPVRGTLPGVPASLAPCGSMSAQTSTKPHACGQALCSPWRPLCCMRVLGAWERWKGLWCKVELVMKGNGGGGAPWFGGLPVTVSSGRLGSGYTVVCRLMRRPVALSRSELRTRRAAGRHHPPCRATRAATSQQQLASTVRDPHNTSHAMCRASGLAPVSRTVLLSSPSRFAPRAFVAITRAADTGRVRRNSVAAVRRHSGG